MPYYGGTPMATDPQFLMQRLMANGMSRVQAAAVLGNLQKESGLASNNMNKDEGAYGLMQWRGPRFDQLQQFAATKGTAWTDPGTQADFIAHEMNTTERKNAVPFAAARTVDEASAALKPVIRHGDDSGAERAMHARNFFGADAAPETAAAPDASATPATAQPAVSRETPANLSPYERSQLGYASTRGHGLRAGIGSLGDIGTAYLGKQRRDAALQQQVQRQLQAPPQPLPPAAGGGPVDSNPAFLGGRDSLAAQVAGPPPAAVSEVPAGAPEPPRFPGGMPQPRPRPLTGPSLPPDDRLLGAGPTVAEMGSLVDPMGWDYG